MSDVFYPHGLAEGYAADHEAIPDLKRAFEVAKPPSVTRFVTLARDHQGFIDFRVIVQHGSLGVGHADCEVTPEALEGGRPATLRSIVATWLAGLKAPA